MNAVAINFYWERRWIYFPIHYIINNKNNAFAGNNIYFEINIFPVQHNEFKYFINIRRLKNNNSERYFAWILM